MWPVEAEAYPLDGAERTGIHRLEGYRLAQERMVRGRRLPSGATNNSEHVKLRLARQPGMQIPAPDPKMSADITRLAGYQRNSYGVAVLDLTDINNPVYAEHNGTRQQNPGSVGKIIVGLGLFQMLADTYPHDIEKRISVLRDTMITADSFIRSDHHKIPIWKPGETRIRKVKLTEGMVANLWTYLDWMLSSSNNSAAATIQKHMILLAHFGKNYPPTPEQERQFFKNTKRREMTNLFAKAIRDPMTRNGLDTKQLRQGSFFTWMGKRRVQGWSNSVGTPRELIKYLFQMERGKLVDYFSSLELKRLLYLTDRRIRYASSPALNSSAVYYKSGSLYKCRPEPGFVCKKYMGNVVNNLNSVIIVESPTKPKPLFYMVAVTSNVLRMNSAVVHQTLATRIHRYLEKRHGVIEPKKKSRGKRAKPVKTPSAE
ncbi:MAG: hypothetical protein HQL53_04385 [Magnetococcales bacterium]|nr:hypothetical protein [Magnetococcales bacterium]